MPLFIYEKKSFIFMHVPKSGGSSVEWTLKKTCKTHMLNANVNSNKSLSMPCNPQHFHAEIMESFFDSTEIDFSFLVVREPLQRLLSEYKYRKLSRTKRGLKIKPFSEWVQTTFEKYEDNSYILDNHIRPQSEFIYPNANIFKLENGLGEVIKFVSSKLEINTDQFTEAHRNSSSNEKIEVDSKVIKLVHEFYSKDYELLGYKR